MSVYPCKSKHLQPWLGLERPTYRLIIGVKFTSHGLDGMPGPTVTPWMLLSLKIGFPLTLNYQIWNQQNKWSSNNILLPPCTEIEVVWRMLINKHRKNCQDEYCKKHPFTNCNVFNLPTLKCMAKTTCIGIHRNWDCCETGSLFVSSRCKFDGTWLYSSHRITSKGYEREPSTCTFTEPETNLISL
jgi:hypothetical protein